MSLTTDVRGGQPSGENFEAIEQAVMESPRGRWFLNEYATRLRSRETLSLLDSMHRIETATAANHDAVMARLSQALTGSKAPAAEPKPQADLAPKHMKYFKRDEEIFEPAPQAKIATVGEKPATVESRGAKLVIRRTGEPAPEPAIAARPAADAGPAHEKAPEPAPLAAAAPAAGHEAASKRRIVIIRHKPGEEMNVPLQNELVAAAN